jgi:hypothetical protein
MWEKEKGFESGDSRLGCPPRTARLLFGKHNEI